MKLITAVVRPHKADDIQAALSGAGVVGMTVSEVRGFGRQGGHSEMYRGVEYQLQFLPKIRIDVVVDEAMVDQAIEAISAAAATGKIGDGKIWLTNVEDVVRIRTGQRGSDAI